MACRPVKWIIGGRLDKPATDTHHMGRKGSRRATRCMPWNNPQLQIGRGILAAQKSKCSPTPGPFARNRSTSSSKYTPGTLRSLSSLCSQRWHSQHDASPCPPLRRPRPGPRGDHSLGPRHPPVSPFLCVVFSSAIIFRSSPRSRSIRVVHVPRTPPLLPDSLFFFLLSPDHPDVSDGAVSPSSEQQEETSQRLLQAIWSLPLNLPPFVAAKVATNYTGMMPMERFKAETLGGTARVGCVSDTCSSCRANSGSPCGERGPEDTTPSS